MDLGGRISEIQKRVAEHREVLLTEEAAKTALVMPMIQALGFDVFNPKEVIPEYTADVSIKKGEKVDYALLIDGSLKVLIECKPSNVDLSLKNAAQLFRYFSVCDARLAILTNGVKYQFYSDLDDVNKMDDRPFFTFNIESFRQADLRTLEKFTREKFDVDAIVSEAGSLRTQTQLRHELEAEFRTPSEEFVKLMTAKVVTGRNTTQARQQIQDLLPGAINALIRDLVTERLSEALNASRPSAEEENVEAPEAVITTEEELSGYRIIQAIAARHVDPKRLYLRDAKSYCAILLDDNNRKPVARLHFDSLTRKYVGTFEGKVETKHLIAEITDIYKLTDLISGQVQALLNNS